MTDQDNTPILVVVKDGRYDAFGLTSTPTERDRYLIGYLKGMGGVNHSVAEGRHLFNVEIVGSSTIASLKPL